MKRKFQPIIRARKLQSGAALIVSLVILGVITLIGVSNMETTNMQMKMVSHDRDRSDAFALADAALTEVEYLLSKKLEIRRENLEDDCDPATTFCFTDNCTGGKDYPGFCFDGSWPFSKTEYECSVGKTAAAGGERVKFWSDETLDVWDTAGRHGVVTVSDDNIEVKYIVEFLCFVDPSPSDNDIFGIASGQNPDGGQPLFRITAFTAGGKRVAPVALQSTYVVNCVDC
ncbi:PilX N-terminal domain-containing pilus assembly protein [Teredinibacter sp. KSP-S5-2]|uniref:pilus assembly PilX family protein n=1 Tax=Teredinibacter sp. KSP-S5-2 TaxID=3034506 RepID=UPI0029350291|nr:PilX N-terminal domain-containing pilus assembly protein [Teredinibacter sp. KSP-S5-2]WNO09863.1 PilX N-terminal domain-containing pilus assembly protein [Teredinibacter sp. KSP-S5-2]